mgnify:CR=1 FL=1
MGGILKDKRVLTHSNAVACFCDGFFDALGNEGGEGRQMTLRFREFC